MEANKQDQPPNLAVLAEVLVEQRDAAMTQVAYLEAQLRTERITHAIEIKSLQGTIAQMRDEESPKE